MGHLGVCPMLLHDYLVRYNRTHDISSGTYTHYHWVLRSFERLNGHPVHISELTGDAVDSWLIRLRDLGRSPWTIKQRKISLLVIWRAAWMEHLAPPLDPVRRLRPLHHSPTAWTLAEVRTLIATAESYPVRSAWTATLVRVGYDTGARLGDLLTIRVGQITTNLLRLVQHKTGRPVCLRLRPQTIQAVADHTVGQSPTALVWPLWGRREAFYRHFRRVVSSSGIRPGTFRWLRRTAATQLERVSPGRGTELLGHASRATTEAWYLDRSQLVEPPLPPL
jgi:integrase